MSLPRAFCLPRDSQGLKLKLFLFVIPLIRSSRDTSRSPRDRRSQKWNCRSPSTAWRYSIPRRKWAQKILEFLYRSAGAATPTPVTWSSADNKHRVEKRSDLVSTFIKWVNNECLVCVFFCFFSQDVQHNCQLHRISFCADDKTDKRIFTFICKDSESNKHLCYVFDSEKCVSVSGFLVCLHGNKV